MAQWYRNALKAFINHEADWDSDSVVATLHTSSYVPNLDTHAYVSDLTNELAASGGYSTGGVALASKQITITAANAFSTARANSTAYLVDDVFRPASGNGFLYRVTGAGTGGGSPPTFPTIIGREVADGSAVIACVGRGIIVLSAASPSWAPATFTGARWGVISDRTPGSAAAQPLIALVDFVSDQAGGGGSFAVNFSPPGVAYIPVP